MYGLVGQRVDRNTIIGLMGASGNVTRKASSFWNKKWK